MGFNLDIGTLQHTLAGIPPKADAALKVLAETGALSMQNYARSNAPWTDRTAHARQRLEGTVESIPKGYRIIIAHGVDYGIYLECAHEKKYAILQKTVDTVGNQEVLPALEKLWEKIT